MKLSDSLVQDLRELFSEVECEGSLEDCLDELSSLVARILKAKGCAIILLTEEEARCTKSGNRSGFGFLPGTPERVRKSLPHLTPSTPSDSAAGRSEGRIDSMFSTIVLRGKLIGFIQATLPQQQDSFSRHDLDLFSILTPIIAKSIQVIQLQQLLKSRFTQIALSQSGDQIAQDMLSGVMQNPNKIARILARSFYREMLRAGFSFNQIIFAATEVISELSAGLRRHGARHRNIDIADEVHPERFWGAAKSVSDNPGAGPAHRIPA